MVDDLTIEDDGTMVDDVTMVDDGTIEDDGTMVDDVTMVLEARVAPAGSGADVAFENGATMAGCWTLCAASTSVERKREREAHNKRQTAVPSDRGRRAGACTGLPRSQ